jgi:DNA topoisomerase-1
VDTGIPCPREGCEGALIKRTSRKGKVFWGCSKYPDCDFAMWDEPTEKRCPECGSLMGKKITKTGALLACSSKPCGYKEPLPEETDK